MVFARLDIREGQRHARLSKQMRRVCTRVLESKLLLSPEQAIAFRAAVGGKNVFLSGGAGTGKSYLLKKIQSFLNPDTHAVCASTGCAAALIGANTLHSTVGIGLGTAPAGVYIAKLRENRFAFNRMRSLLTLVVDEVGMLDGATFDKAGAVLAGVRRGFESGATASAAAAFDDIQIIACGDFLQLPPVEAAKNKWVFESASWKALRFEVHVLNQCHRQSDVAFVAVLGRVRTGCASQDDVDYLQANSAPDPLEGALRLFATNPPAEATNAHELMRLVNESKAVAHVFNAVDRGALGKLKHSPAPEKLWLCEGARVMCLRNLLQGQLVNGSLGTISKITVCRDADEKPTGAVISVRFDGVLGAGGFTHSFETYNENMAASDVARIYAFSVKEGKHEVASRIQIPLKLAWACSIHKSQGMSLDRAVINFAGTFENGQAYTALSRMRTLAGAHLAGLKLAHLKKVAKKPLAWYQGLSKKHWE